MNEKGKLLIMQKTLKRGCEWDGKFLSFFYVSCMIRRRCLHNVEASARNENFHPEEIPYQMRDNFRVCVDKKKSMELLKYANDVKLRH